MNLAYGPKARTLTTSESVSTLEAWKANILYGLQLNPDFREYLEENFTFGKKNKLQPNRTLADVYRKETVTDEKGEVKEILVQVKSKEDRACQVDTLLQQVANYCPYVPREDIVKECTSMKDVWRTIRTFYNKQQRGSSMNEIWDVHREVEETPQALYARIKQLYLDNLLKADGLLHTDGQVDEDEEMSPSLLNTVILHWLQALHPGLRTMVTQRFITQLRDHTFAAILPEIFQSVDSLLDEANSSAAVNRLSNTYQHRTNYYQNRSSQPNRSSYKPTFTPNTYKPRQSSFKSNIQPRQPISKQCQFCKLTGKKMFHTHQIEDCFFIKRMNQPQSMNIRQVCPEADDYELQCQEFYEFTDEEEFSHPVDYVLNHVKSDASPVIEFQTNNQACLVTLDTGAPCNLINQRKALQLNASIKPTAQRVRQADGSTYLDVVGEADITLYYNNKPYRLPAIVCRDTDTEILAGMPFMKNNDVAIRPFTDEIILGGTEFVKYDPNGTSSNTIRRLTIHSSKQHVILPGESAPFQVHGVSGPVAVEPRWDLAYNKQTKESSFWPNPEMMEVVDGMISIKNPFKDPIVIYKSEPICNLHMVKPNTTVPNVQVIKSDNAITLYQNQNKQSVASPLNPSYKHSRALLNSTSVSLNPDGMLSKHEEESFRNILSTYDEVFSPNTTTYNGHSGPCYVKVNIGPNPPPQKKGRIPFYGDSGLQELQDHFDDLHRKGILSRPEEIGVTVENINPSFLVHKPPPSTKKRLVTDFKSIANYCRPSPSLLPDVETTIRRISSMAVIIKTDMTSAYYQIEMKKESKRFCGVHTPFKGILVYNVGVMGLPGVESALEELTCLVLGDLVRDGRVCKLADDLFIGGNTVQEAMETFKLVLHKLQENNLKLSPTKTFIAPNSVSILGWTWTAGKLKASQHKLSALAACPPPSTVAALKSFLGSYRFISRVIRGYASLLAPLEEVIKGKEQKEVIVWNEQLSNAFKKAKDAINHSKAIVVPRPTDRLSIVTDASVRPGAIGATLYAIRNNKPELAGFFNCKLPEYQRRWLPCELEALSIATALHHYSPYIIQSTQKPQILTDSKPCVDAANKLARGEFSTSARLSTFISATSRYNASVSHIPGSLNILSDYASRNPLECLSKATCAVCKFVSEQMDSVIQNITVEDILEGRARMPWTNRNVWSDIQMECSVLRKVKFFKSRGTQPNKKSKNMRQVRKYLSSGTILAHDGVLINPYSPPLGPVHERIVIPDQIVHGLLTMLHIKSHPTAHNLKLAFSRYFYAINSERYIKEVTQACSQCAALKDLPKAMIPESSEPPPASVGGNFAADVVKRWSQKIFCIRESVTSYTLADLIPNETKETIADVLVKQCNLLRPSSASPITIRLDPHPSHQALFKSLQSHTILARQNINIELGRTLNKNKNPVIDKGIKELIRELLILQPEGGPVSTLTLSQSVANLNSRYRKSGMSSQELWTQRDQITGDQLPISDRNLIIQQHLTRSKNHPHSEKCKSQGKPPHPSAKVTVGTLVYIYSDRSKTQARQRYLVSSIEGESVLLRRFTKYLIGKDELKAKLHEIYRVPSIEDIRILSDSESSDDETSIVNEPTSDKNLTIIDQEEAQVASNASESESSVNEEEEEYNEHSGSDVSQRSDDDPSFRVPANLVPAVMQRPKRVTKPPDRLNL